MQLDERLAQEIKDYQQRQLHEGKLPTPDQLKQYYATFRERFGPERLLSLDGEALLEYMHGRGGNNSLVYWLEFKGDEEFPTIEFGSIAGGSSLKFGIFKSAQTGLWMSGTPQNTQQLSIEEAVERARTQRNQLVRGVAVLQQFPSHGSDDDYRMLQAQMNDEAPDVSQVAWGHKYFSLLAPDKLDDYHMEHHQRYHLMKLLQVPPEGKGRYLTAGRFVAIADQLDMPLNHLTTVLNRLHGRPHQYWRVGTMLGEDQWDIWPDDRDGSFIAIGWGLLGNLSSFSDYSALTDHIRQGLEEHYPNTQSVTTRKANEIKNFAGLMNAGIQVGDLVLAANGETILGVGRVTGEYQHVPGSEFPHRRPVEWLSLEPWKLLEREGLRTTVNELKSPANLVEAERRILAGVKLLPSPRDKSEMEVSVPPRLKGIPAQIQVILERKGQVILYGPPGTGKTYWAEQAALNLAAIGLFNRLFEQLTIEQQARIIGHYVRICSFHPNYGYEDFLEGYRPDVVGDQMTFARRDGLFKQLCEAAQAEPERNFYLIIDEINRGDIPRIFGELLTVLEKDKRGKTILLPLSEKPFQVPRNVYLIGTMNTADRSIALLDTALRRRFGFVELMPDYDVLGDAVVEGVPLAPWLEALNRRIVENVGRDARNLQIGHAYLLEGSKPVSSFARFARLVQEDIIPLLEEYCYEDYATLEKILGKGLVDARDQRILHELFDPARQDDFIQALLAPSPEITTSVQAAASEQVAAEESDDQDELDTNEGS